MKNYSEREELRMERPIRVLHVIGIMNRGGAETMIMNLYRNIDRSRVQFDFVENSFAPAAFDEEITALGGRIYRCPHYTGINHFAYRRWWEEFFRVHEGEYCIVHGHIGSTAAIYLKIAKRHGLFAIAHSHSSGTDHSLKSALYKLMSYNTRNIADHFFACSEIAGVERFGERVTKGSNYRVLNNAIDTAAFQYDEQVREQVRAELGCGAQTVIGHIGRFTGEKNHTFLLKVFSEIVSRKPESRLLLVGDGPLRPKMEERAKELGIGEKVIFTGVRSDVNRLVRAMDIFVFPSIYEGLGISLVEAQTSGLPCVISDHVPTESILTEGLVTVQSLDDSAAQWAEHILSRMGEERRSRCNEVRAHGYDIAETAKWLEAFYVEKAEKV